MKRRQRQRITPNRIAFGSCNEQSKQNNLWPIIEARKPAAFVWGGDSIYADMEEPTSWTPKESRMKCGTPNHVRRLYQQQLSVPGYRRLVNSNMTIFGTIDDHDFGCDNANKNFPYKYGNTNAFIDFIGENENSLMGKRAADGLGVYGVKLFDFHRPEGQYLVPDLEACIDPQTWCTKGDANPAYSNRSVAVFVLDVRTNKDPWMQGFRAYHSKDYEGDFLGDEQWKWFEEALANSKAAVNVIVNGLQVNANLFPNPNIAESWSGFPRSQQRLFDTILGDSVAAPILISGDVHMTQMMRKDCRKSNEPEERRSVVEMTTSGMTHSWGKIHSAPLNDPDYRYGVLSRIEAMIGRLFMHIMHLLQPWTQLMVSSDNPSISHDGGMEGAKKGLQFSLERNFGELEFDWGERTVWMRSIGEEGKILLSSKISMDQLSGRSPMMTSGVTDNDFQAEEMSYHPALAREWVCVSHRGRVGTINQAFGHVRTLGGAAAIFSLPILLSTYCLVLMLKWRSRGTRKSWCYNLLATSRRQPFSSP